MCIDFLAQVIERDGDTVVVETEGRTRRASTLLLPDLRVGEWVYVAAGTVIERVDENEAQMVNELLRNAQGAPS